MVKTIITTQFRKGIILIAFIVTIRFNATIDVEVNGKWFVD